MRSQIWLFVFFIVFIHMLTCQWFGVGHDVSHAIYYNRYDTLIIIVKYAHIIQSSYKPCTKKIIRLQILLWLTRTSEIRLFNSSVQRVCHPSRILHKTAKYLAFQCTLPGNVFMCGASDWGIHIHKTNIYLITIILKFDRMQVIIYSRVCGAYARKLSV